MWGRTLPVPAPDGQPIWLGRGWDLRNAADGRLSLSRAECGDVSRAVYTGWRSGAGLGGLCWSSEQGGARDLAGSRKPVMGALRKRGQCRGEGTQVERGEWSGALESSDPLGLEEGWDPPGEGGPACVCVWGGCVFLHTQLHAHSHFLTHNRTHLNLHTYPLHSLSRIHECVHSPSHECVHRHIRTPKLPFPRALSHTHVYTSLMEGTLGL